MDKEIDILSFFYYTYTDAVTVTPRYRIPIWDFGILPSWQRLSGEVLVPLTDRPGDFARQCTSGLYRKKHMKNQERLPVNGGESERK